MRSNGGREQIQWMSLYPLSTNITFSPIEVCKLLHIRVISRNQMNLIIALLVADEILIESKREPGSYCLMGDWYYAIAMMNAENR